VIAIKGFARRHRSLVERDIDADDDLIDGDDAIAVAISDADIRSDLRLHTRMNEERQYRQHRRPVASRSPAFGPDV
jgi:hypothetical protein